MSRLPDEDGYTNEIEDEEDDGEDKDKEDEIHHPKEDSLSYGSSTSSANKGSPKNESSESLHPFIKSKPPFGAMLPLEFFDDEEFDIRSGEDWIRLGYDAKEDINYPIPGKAFLPFIKSNGEEEHENNLAISQVTYEQLLKKTPRLEKFHQQLVRARFNRMLQNAGIDPAKGK